MKIKVKKLVIQNFKGIRSLVIDFKQNPTLICGDNGTGKTTVFDAFKWNLFGKDSQDRKDFSLKTIEKDGTVPEQIDHEVECVLELDRGDSNVILKTFKRTLREKWVKKRGKSEQQFEGHETLYTIDGVPVTMKEYNDTIDAICEESVFKLITDPRYFPSLNWSVQRETLIKMVGGDITDQEIAEKDPKFSEFFNRISGRTIEQHRKYVANEKARIKEEWEKIPARIDEASRTLPEAVPEISGHALKVKEATDKIALLDKAALDSSEASKQIAENKLSIQREVNKFSGQMQDIAFQIKQALKKDKNELQAQFTQTRDRISLLEKSNQTTLMAIDEVNSRVNKYKEQRETLLKEYNELKKQSFSMDENALICPTCKRELDPDTIEIKQEEMRQAWNINHTNKLNDNISKGKSITASITAEAGKTDDLLRAVSETKEKIDALKIEKNEIEIQMPTLTEDQYDDMVDDLLEGKYSQKNEEITNMIAEYHNAGNKKVEAEVRLKNTSSEPDPLCQEDITLKKSLQILIENLQEDIRVEAAASKTNARIAELKKIQKQMAQQLADLEKDEYLMAAFTKTKIMALEEKINKMFLLVSFRMYRFLINGSEEPTCEAIIDGVPYSDLNHASKINAGIDIINAISDKNGIWAPVFVDNAESVLRLQPTSTQLIKLIATPDKQLTIS